MANHPAAGYCRANHVTPMNTDSRDALALRFAQIACDAGGMVMASSRVASRKADGSPVTEADQSAERLIRSRLAALDPALPVVAEEGFRDDAREAPSRFVLVDPLDGTR